MHLFFPKYNSIPKITDNHCLHARLILFNNQLSLHLFLSHSGVFQSIGERSVCSDNLPTAAHYLCISTALCNLFLFEIALSVQLALLYFVPAKPDSSSQAAP